ncbi:hypothetical protein [Thalassotalea sediminis]|uniref:hypothetical protein n=1 Tax=Thalassotalea sediminis TaxID=1759089 RepID=UPI0025733F30|nr:hypothetical protein [Thalassotalea sediminis]
MEDSLPRDPLIERRHFDSVQEGLWARLSIAQKFSASSLVKYGYELAFIRHSSSNSVAVMLLDDKITTISSDGEIDTAPNIKLR